MPVRIAAFGYLLASVSCSAQSSSFTGTTTFVLDGNRMYAALCFVRPDGSVHRALAFVDLGSSSMELTASLFDELQLDHNQPLRFKVGDLSIEVPREAISDERTRAHSVGSDLAVEAMLPAGVLQRYLVVIDYHQRTLTLTSSVADEPRGVPVPVHINPQTGLIAVDASIDGKSYPITIDNGSAYTWVRQSTARAWLVAHPEWERGVGAVGAANMTMSGDGTETLGTLLRIPEVSVGSLVLKDVGALAAGPGRTFSGNRDLFDWYSQKNAGPVIGWIGGNVLKGFRLTIDYANRTTYWLRQSDPDARDLHQVELTLQFTRGEYIVAAVATRHGMPTVTGVLPGDKLIQVDGLKTNGASWGGMYRAMHGSPGETRSLVLDRNGHRFTVAAPVTAF